MDPVTPPSPNADPTLKCEIAAQALGGATTLQGFVVGGQSETGRYTLRVRKTGPAGTSDIAQAGTFTTEPGVRLGLGIVSVSLERTGRYDALLTLALRDRTVECRAAGPATSDL